MERFWVLLAKLGFWIPTSKCMPLGKYNLGWILIAFVDCNATKGSRPLPAIADFDEVTKEWHLRMGDEYDETYFKRCCEVTHWRKIPMEPVRRKENRRNK